MITIKWDPLDANKPREKKRLLLIIGHSTFHICRREAQNIVRDISRRINPVPKYHHHDGHGNIMVKNKIRFTGIKDA
jgi:hypothetical protein